jgi:Flp pilus assembly protein TadG
MRCRIHSSAARRGASAVEAAILLPMLAFLFVAGVDYARVFYHSVTLTNCAQNGAAFARLTPYDPQSPYKTVTEAALADASNLSPTPTVSSRNYADAGGRQVVEVSVTYPFRTVFNWTGAAGYSGIADVTQLTRTVRMEKAPNNPNY